MIIDFTRQFSHDKFNSYCDLVDLWWDKYDEYKQDCDEAEEELDEMYDEEASCLQEPTCFVDLMNYNNLELDLKELVYLDELCRKSTEFIDELKFKHNFCSEIYLPLCDEKKTSMLKFLERKNASYFLICRLHPTNREVLLIRDPDICKEFKLLFEIQNLLSSDVSWLVDVRGWVGIERVERLSFTALSIWLNDNCSGYWRMYDSSTTWPPRFKKIYFQQESDLMLYVLRFKGNEE